MKLGVKKFAELSGGELFGFSEDVMLRGFCLDSREVEPDSLYVAIRGARHDGHDFVKDALLAGACGSLVERSVQGPHILVPNVVAALAKFGSSIRAEFNGPVVGITGSNGKTATKELTAACLEFRGPVLKSGGNRNTEFTSPLTWADLKPEHWCAVIEMAMRGPGQIQHLREVCRPTIAVITMIGTAHIEMVGGREGIARAKAEIFDAEEVAVLWAEDELFGTLRSLAKGRVRTFGFSPETECRVLGYRAQSWTKSTALFEIGGRTAEASLPTVGRHQALNAAAALLVADSLGISIEDAAPCLANAQLPPMRMEAVRVHGATVLLDNYNASPDSAVAAIKTLSELPCTGKRFAVIGEMRELGDFSETGHRLVGRAIAEAPFDGVILFGAETRFVHSEAVRAGYPDDRLIEASDIGEITAFLNQLSPHDVALIKGSRALELEKALDDLEVARA